MPVTLKYSSRSEIILPTQCLINVRLKDSKRLINALPFTPRDVEDESYEMTIHHTF